MKRLLSILGTITSIILVFSGISLAYSFGIEDFTGTYQYGNINQGTYLGTVYNGNDDVDTLKDFFFWKGLTADSLSLFGKTDLGTLFTPELEGDDDGGFISGTWQTFQDAVPQDPDRVDFILVKGGTSFSVHQYDPAAFSGEWNVGYLDEVGNKGVNVPAVSHVSAYVTDVANVPEPGTLFLLGAGFLGLAGMSRRRIKP